MSRVQLLEVNEGDGDQRLDRWFRRLFPQVQQGQIEKMCRKGDIRVDGGRVKSNTRVEVGQVVRIPPLPDTPAPAIIDKKISDADAKMIQSCVLYRVEQTAGPARTGGQQAASPCGRPHPCAAVRK